MTNGSRSLEEKLAAILEHHEGRANAITSREIQQLTGADDRRIRLAIRELIKDGLPIASATDSPPGYFLIANWQEAEGYAQSIRDRLIEDARRRRDFRRSAVLHLTPARQVKMI